MSGSTSALKYYDVPTASPEAVLAMEGTRRFDAPPINNTRAKNIHAKVARANAVREKEVKYGVDRTKAQTQAQVRAKPKTQSVSVIAVAGTLIVAVLMIFVVLAQIYYNDAVRETVRLNAQLTELSERQRSLELAFVSAIDIREVERFARDELGMTRPDAGDVIFLNSAVRDSAVVVEQTEENNTESFISFLVSLTDYFR